MASIYLFGTVGPWYVDDEGVALDGVVLNGELVHHPTVDGLGLRPRRSRFFDSDDRDLFLGRVVRHEDRSRSR